MSLPTPDQLRTISYMVPEAPDELLVTNQDLLEISTRAWGDPMYGRTAADILRMVRPVGDVEIAEVGGKITNSLSANPRAHDWQVSHILYHHTDVPTAQLESDARRQWHELALPFVPLITTDDEQPNMQSWIGRHPTRLKIAVGPVIRPLLANFVGQWGYADHCQLQTLGKAMDVLNIAAFGSREIGQSNVAMDMIPQQELLLRLRGSEVSPKVRSRVAEAIRQSISGQVLQPHRPPDRQVVLGGEVYLTDRHRWTYEAIAVDSLKVIAEQRFSEGTAPRRILETIAEA